MKELEDGGGRPRGGRHALECGEYRGYKRLRCGAADISRITAPPTLLVRASNRGPEVVAHDLYNVPPNLFVSNQIRKERQDRQDKYANLYKKKKPLVRNRFGFRFPIINYFLLNSRRYYYD